MFSTLQLHYCKLYFAKTRRVGKFPRNTGKLCSKLAVGKLVGVLDKTWKDFPNIE